MDAHLDMEELTKGIFEQRAQKLMYKAIVTGDLIAMAKLEKEGTVAGTKSMEQCARENAIKRQEIFLGTRQVESLLRFMVSRELLYEMEDAEADNLVYDKLGEHRILGKKKTKKRTVSY